MEYYIIALLWLLTIVGFIVYYKKTRQKLKKEVYRELVRTEYVKIKEAAKSELATVTAQSDAIKRQAEELRKNFEQQKILQDVQLKETLEKQTAANERILQEQRQRIFNEQESYYKEQKNLIDQELKNYLNEEKNKAEEQLRLKKSEFETVTARLNEQLERDCAAVADFHQKRLAINEAMRREQELKNQTDFHRICINEQEQSDINLISSWKGQLHNKAAINKLIWDIYIKNNLKDMQKRVLNGNSFGGIYKITRIDTGEAYIGRSSNILERWTNHLKTACGLEGAAPSAIHKAMATYGIWNFTFEVLEKVNDSSKLGEREKFYIELYETDKQYNMSKGG